MASIENHNPVFDIVPAPTKENRWAHQVRFKGKVYDKKFIECYPRELVVNLPPKKFLDFDAQYFPEQFEVYMFFKPVAVFKTFDMLILRKKGKFIEAGYSIHITKPHMEDWDINPVKVLKDLTKVLIKAGYKKAEYSNADVAYYAVNVKIRVPAKGNLLKAVERHIPVFEDLMKETIAQVKRRISTSKK